MSLFGEWFHTEWLMQNGPVDPKCSVSRERHRAAKHWAETAWMEATLRAARICGSVNNYDNPMTATDCADEIRKAV